MDIFVSNTHGTISRNFIVGHPTKYQDNYHQMTNTTLKRLTTRHATNISNLTLYLHQCIHLRSPKNTQIIHHETPCFPPQPSIICCLATSTNSVRGTTIRWQSVVDNCHWAQSLQKLKCGNKQHITHDEPVDILFAQ
jgi:hypothetical protein